MEGGIGMRMKILGVAAAAVLAVTGALLWLTEDRMASARRREADLSLRAPVQAVGQGLQAELADLRAILARESNEVIGSWKLLHPVSGILTFRRQGAELTEARWLHSDLGPQRNVTDDMAVKLLKGRLPATLPEGTVTSLWLKGASDSSSVLLLISRRADRWTALWTTPGWMQSLVDLHKSAVGELMILDSRGRILAHSESEYSGSEIPGSSVMKWVLESGETNGLNFDEWPEDRAQVAAYERVAGADWVVIHASSNDRLGGSGWSEFLLFGGAAALGILLLAGVVLARLLARMENATAAIVAPVSPRPVMAVAPRPEVSGGAQLAQTKNDRLATSSRIASVVGQELSAPLAAILGYAQTILSTKPEATVAGAAESVLRESRRAREVVDKLLAFSGEAPVGKTSGRLSAVVAKVLKEFESRFTHKQVKVIKTLPSTSEIPLASASLEKAIRHLLENAVEAMDRMPTKELHITLSETPDAIRLQIRDTGEGISRENLPKVTDPFFTTRSSAQNMGLGLSAAHGVFKDHGADMKIESENGKGTTVSVEFPRPQKKVEIGGEQVSLKVEERVRIPSDLPKPVQPEPVVASSPESATEGPRVLTPPSPAQVDIEGLLNMAEEAALEPVHEPHSSPPDAGEEGGSGNGDEADLEMPAGLDFVEARTAAPAAAAANEDLDRTVIVAADEVPDFVSDGEESSPAPNAVDAPKFSAPKRERKLDQVKVEVRRPGAGNQG